MSALVGKIRSTVVCNSPPSTSNKGAPTGALLLDKIRANIVCKSPSPSTTNTQSPTGALLLDQIRSNIVCKAPSSSAVKMHATATVNGTVIADTDNYEFVEGNVYFPEQSLNQIYLAETETTTTCPWKGKATYFTVAVGNTVLKDVAWSYPNPYEKAQHIKNYVAFDKSKVTISK